MNRLLLSTLFISLTVYLFADPVRFQPHTIYQPDGTPIECFLSGDEFFNWIHDAEGYSIIKGVGGYYYYAERVDGKIVASEHRVTRTKAAIVGLEKWVIISNEEYQQRRESYYSSMKEDALKKSKEEDYTAFAPLTGTLNNIVIYIRFNGEDEFESTRSSYEELFNSTTGPSLRGYYREASYNNLTINSTQYPSTANPSTSNASYEDSHPREYFQVYDEITNPIGYQPGERSAREHQLLIDAINWVNQNSPVPNNIELDNDSDGYIDCVTFIFKGFPEGWSELLWGHMSGLPSNSVFINNIPVSRYTFQPESSQLRTFAHETFHILGAPDLYHYDEDYRSLHPVFRWDIMEYGRGHMGAYMKWRYAGNNWISSIPEITSSGTYTLNPITSPTNNCYRIASPYSTSEFFVVEYRRQTGHYESTLDGEGLLVYRINTNHRGNAGFNNSTTFDEVYIYRPNGTTNEDGQPNNAHFSEGVGRTQINDNSNPSSFLHDGATGGLDITSVSQAGNTISFTINMDGPNQPNLTYSSNQNSLNVSGTNVGLSMRVVNEGGATADESFVTYYLSTNTTISTSDYPIGEDYVTSLGVGGYSDESLNVDVTTVIPTIPSGTYYVGYIIDYRDDVNESNENDNDYVFTSQQVTIPGDNEDPNLTYNPNSNILDVSGTDIGISLRVRNVGTEPADESYVGYYLSEDTNMTTGDYFLGEDWVPLLESGDENPEGLSIDVATVDPAIPPGNYYAGYIIDYRNDVNESNENDNDFVFTSQQVTIPDDREPNLTYNPNYNNLSVSGTNVSLSLRVINQGDAAAGDCYVAYYLSTNSSILTNDYYIGQNYIPSLSEGGYSNESISVDVTDANPDIPPGTYYVGYIIDYQDVVDESDENDNAYAFTSQQVIIPDNREPNLTYNPNYNNLSASGTNLSLSMRVINQGDAAAGDCYVGYYLSTNSSISTGDFFIGDDYVPSLGVGGFSDESFSADATTANPDISPGTYYVGYLIDYQDVVDESNENDNAYAFTSPQVTIPDNREPNLTYNPNYNNLSVSGTNVSLSMRVINQGDAAAGESYVAYYLSTNSSISTGDFFIGDDYVPSLGIGGFSDESISVDVLIENPNIPPGVYYVGYLIDYQEAVAESNENDNDHLFSSPLVSIPQTFPNLTPYKPSGWDNEIIVSSVKDTHQNTEVSKGNISYIDFAWMNNGNEDAGNHRICLYLDSDIIGCFESSGLPENQIESISDWEYTFTESRWYTIAIIVDVDNEVDESNEVDNLYQKQIFVEIPDDIPDNTFSDNITLFPNPSGGKFFLEIQSALEERYNIQIIDPTGKVIWENQVERSGSGVKESIDLSSSPAGLYFVKVYNDEFNTVKKLILIE